MKMCREGSGRTEHKKKMGRTRERNIYIKKRTESKITFGKEGVIYDRGGALSNFVDRNDHVHKIKDQSRSKQ